MSEPDNHTALVDNSGDTWVRVDEVSADRYGPWWPLADGPGWEEWARKGIGQPRPWDQVDDGFHGPFTLADPERTAQALQRVLEATWR